MQSINKDQDPLSLYRPKFIQIYSFILISISFFMFILVFTSPFPSNLLPGAILILISSLMILTLERFKKMKAASWLIFIAAICLVSFQGYYQKSAFIMCFLPLLLIMVPILLLPRYIPLVFFLELGIMLTFYFLGIFTLYQTFPPGFDIPLANNLIAPIPLLFLGLIISEIIAKVFIANLKTKSLLLTKAEEANYVKTMFLANISHEIRTPINAIIGFSQILFDGGAGPLTLEQKDLMQDVLQSSEVLKNLLEAVLKTTQFDQNVVILQKNIFNFSDFVNETMKIFETKIKDRQIEVEKDGLNLIGTIIGDKALLQQVLLNLIRNAIKFNLPKGKIRIKAKKSESLLQIIISDTGIGIEQSEINKIFEPFNRIPSALIDSEPGFGLGLSICKKIIELHKGTITVQSEVNKGTEFTVEIPYR